MDQQRRAVQGCRFGLAQGTGGDAGDAEDHQARPDENEDGQKDFGETRRLRARDQPEHNKSRTAQATSEESWQRRLASSTGAT